MPHAHASGFPSPSFRAPDSLPSVGQERLLLTRFGSGRSRTTEWEHRDQEVSPTNNDRGGQAPALRLPRPPPLTVGRGPVPRHRSAHQTSSPLLCSSRAPALDPFRERVLPNYKCGGANRPRDRTIAGDRPPRYAENDVSPSVGQERLILTRSGADAPELQNLAIQCIFHTFIFGAQGINLGLFFR